MTSDSHDYFRRPSSNVRNVHENFLYFQVGDQILEINQTNTKDLTHAEAIELIKDGGSTVRLLIRRGGRVPQVSNRSLINDCVFIVVFSVDKIWCLLTLCRLYFYGRHF